MQWAPVTGGGARRRARCRFISRLGIGYDMIDVAAATQRGMAVANTPDYCVDEVVAHTLAMALWLVRGLGLFDAAVRAGRVDAADGGLPGAPPGRGLRSSAWSGSAASGRGSPARHKALGFQVIGHDPYAASARPASRSPRSRSCCASAHLVTLHAPLTEETRHLIRA